MACSQTRNAPSGDHRHSRLEETLSPPGVVASDCHLPRYAPSFLVASSVCAAHKLMKLETTTAATKILVRPIAPPAQLIFKQKTEVAPATATICGSSANKTSFAP